MQISNLDCRVVEFTETTNTNLLKVKLLVQHDGENKNGSKFSLDAIKKAEPTIKNIPILAFIKRDDNGEAIDFDEHNCITKIVQDENGLKLKTFYLEVPIGVIPSDTEVSYEEINGRTYLSVTGYIWKRYSNEGYDIIMNSEEKGTSMEIEIFDGQLDEEDGFYNVTDYQFLGVTCLGDDVEPGMYETTIQKYSSSKKFKKQLADIYKEIYSLREEEDTVEKTTVEKTDTDITMSVEGEDSKSTITVDPEGIDVKVEDKKFALDMDTMWTAINSQLKNRKVETENYWGEKYQTREFYLMTIIPSENIAVVEDNLNYYNYYGIPFEVKGDDIELNYDAKVPYIQEWREKKTNETIAVFEKEDELKDMVLEKFGKKEEEITKLKDEVEKLKAYKMSKEKEELELETDNILSKFKTLDASETEDIKTRVISGEIELDQFEKELYCLVGMKAFGKDETFSTKEETTEVRIFDNNPDKEDEQLYGGYFEKYGIK